MKKKVCAFSLANNVPKGQIAFVLPSKCAAKIIQRIEIERFYGGVCCRCEVFSRVFTQKVLYVLFFLAQTRHK